MSTKWFIVGGAGFIGSHFVDRLLAEVSTELVTVFDNFTSGQAWHLESHEDDRRLQVVRADVHDDDRLRDAIAGHGTVIHLASNPEIARAASEPDIDFVEGTVLTRSVLEAMRVRQVPTILYASGSGVYGDLGELEAREDHGPLVPVSTYGASKLAGEALIAAYAAMFDLTGLAFRFGNVVGSRQTHGVGFDFVHCLLEDPTRLSILGDGSQSKSYVHVSDVIGAVLTAHEYGKQPFDVFNVATGDYVTVTEIADITAEAVGLKPASVAYQYAGGSKGWRGDVPIVRLNTDRIRALGWRCKLNTRQALRRAAIDLIGEAKARRTAGRIPSAPPTRAG